MKTCNARVLYHCFIKFENVFILSLLWAIVQRWNTLLIFWREKLLDARIRGYTLQLNWIVDFII